MVSVTRSSLSEDQSSQECVINPAIASNWKVSKDENCYKNQKPHEQRKDAEKKNYKAADLQ